MLAVVTPPLPPLPLFPASTPLICHINITLSTSFWSFCLCLTALYHPLWPKLASLLLPASTQFICHIDMMSFASFTVILPLLPTLPLPLLPMSMHQSFASFPFISLPLPTPPSLSLPVSTHQLMIIHFIPFCLTALTHTAFTVTPSKHASINDCLLHFLLSRHPYPCCLCHCS
jgi:hypothetical protein